MKIALFCKTKVSDELTGAGTQSGSPEDTVEFSCTFTCVGGPWSIEEAGLFTVAACTSGMVFYNSDDISVGMATSETLQIDWTVSVS